MDIGTAQIVVTLITVLGTGFVTISAQIYREGRQRRWDIEDRMALAAKLTADAQALQTRLTADALRVQDRVRDVAAMTAQGHAALISAIGENTSLTKEAVNNAKDAYSEANTVNLKIEKLGLAQLAAQIEKKVGD